MRRGIYSIGTNSTRALVADVDGNEGEIVDQWSIGTRLGEGLRERGHLNDDAMERTIDALREHCKNVEPFTHDVVAIATSAVRRADNADAFAQKVRDVTGAELQVIDGEEEASCSFAGAVAVAPHEPQTDLYGVVDTGGGSTEYAAGERGAQPHTVSCEIGAVRLSESLPELLGERGTVDAKVLHEARTKAREALRPLCDFPKVQQLLFVGGTATTCVSIVRGRREEITIAPLPLTEIQQIITHLASKPLEERKTIPGMNPQRADIMLAGSLILEAAFDLTGHRDALASMGDLLLGYLLRHPKR